jgi:anti-sigma regulatory factor (Ser/Thr protein kinase)
LEIDLQIEPEPEALSDARRSLDDLEDSMAPKSLEHVRLLTSELLTNSVRHASLDSGERIGLRVVASPERVRVEVSRLSAPPYEEMRNYHLGA